MYLFDTRSDKPPLYAGIAVVSLMISAGLTIAGTVVVLTVMFLLPVFVVLSPILIVPAVITSSFLVTGFLASGSLGASAIALLVWLYKKQEHASYTLHAREVQPEKASKLAGGGKLAGGDKPQEEAKPPERDKLAEDNEPGIKKPREAENKLQRVDQSPKGEKLAEEANPREENKQPGSDVMAEEGRDQSPDRNKLTEEVKQTEEGTLISEITKVLSEEQHPIGHKSCGRSTSSTKKYHQIRFPTKDPSMFMKEYQKAPRVGALAYKYFTARDKLYTNHIR